MLTVRVWLGAARRHAPTTRVREPIFAAIDAAAPLNERTAGIAPAPFVERTHAWPRSLQTLAICGMFGIGTPPLLAVENWLSTGLFDFAFRFAGGRPPATENCVCAEGVEK